MYTNIPIDITVGVKTNFGFDSFLKNSTLLASILEKSINKVTTDNISINTPSPSIKLTDSEALYPNIFAETVANGRKTPIIVIIVPTIPNSFVFVNFSKI